MPYIFVSLILAMIFGLTVHGIYGVEGLYNQWWVDRIFWAIIGCGLVLASLDILRCTACRWLRRHWPEFCQRLSCTEN